MALCIMNLPAEILLELVNYLGIKDFYSLRAVNKGLLQLLQDDKFARAIFKVSITS